MKSMQPTRDSERGAILIMVVVAMVALMAFTAFVIDYGVMWSGRAQIQTSADAAALAGAIALSSDSATDFAGAQTKAIAVGTVNRVWGQAPNIQAADVTFPACPPGAPGLPDTCVKVDAFRNQARGNPLPTYFGNLVGVGSQGVRGTATAQIFAGDTADCVKPFALPDKWQELYPVAKAWAPTDSFDKYKPDNPNKGSLLASPDLYTAPSQGSNGTGYSLPDDLGLALTLKSGSPGDAIQPGWFFPVRVAETDSGATDYKNNIVGCNPRPIGPGTQLEPENGNMVGPTKQGIQDLIALDPAAHWDTATKKVVGGCMAAGTCSRSPRLGAVAVFNPDTYASTRTNGNTMVTVTHVLGFWIDSINNQGDVLGYFCFYPDVASGSSTLAASASFLRKIILVR
jgi:Putative Flp pilus-assembly TadE/G-like